eukprot:7705382-Pyramimonas_sp.AAC.1
MQIEKQIDMHNGMQIQMQIERHIVMTCCMLCRRCRCRTAAVCTSKTGIPQHSRSTTSTSAEM